MIVTCPNCATRYQIEPDALVPNGRYLRCVKCSHQWLERPSAAGGAEAPEEDNFDDLLSPPRRTRRPPARARPARLAGFFTYGRPASNAMRGAQ